MSEQPKLQLFYGGGDMLEAVDDMRERIVKGELDGIVLVGVRPDGYCGWTWAYRDDAMMPWARMFAATASAEHELLAKGL